MSRSSGRFLKQLMGLFLVTLLFASGRNLVAQGQLPGGSSPSGGDGVLAQVNDEVILYSDVVNRIKPQLREYARQFGQQEFRERRQQLFKKSISFMIQEEVLQQEARASGLSVSEKEIQKRKEQIIERVGSKEKFKKGLFQQGLTMQMWERQVRTQILNRKLFRKKFQESQSSFFVSPEEMRSYYEDHTLQFYKEAKVKGHVVSFPFSDTEERDQMVRQALSVREQIDEGASFESIVASYKSLDPDHTRSFDWTKRGEFIKPIEHVLFRGMGGRNIRGPFVAGDRVVILKREGKIKSEQLPLTDPEVQKEIRNQIRQRKRKERLKQIKDRLIEQAYINPRYLLES